MRSGAALGHAGFFHEAALYDSDDEFCEIAVPFLLDGLEADEPTFVILDRGSTVSIRETIGQPAGLTFIRAEDAYIRPATTVKNYIEVLSAQVRSGAEQIRLVAQVPHPGKGTAWDWWGRYESAANEVFKDFPLWAICAYDRRTTPDNAIDEVTRSHPYLASAKGDHGRNSSYETVEIFLGHRTCPYVDAYEATPSAIDVWDPTLSQAREAVSDLASRADLDRHGAEEFAFAVSEVVANAQAHGKSPVRLQMWAGPKRIVATVTDKGEGVPDPLIGLIPVATDSDGGRGLWLAHQLCDHVAMNSSSDGFAVKLVMGSPTVVG